MRTLAVVLAICLMVSPSLSADISDESGMVSAVYIDGREACQPQMVTSIGDMFYLPLISVALSAGFRTVDRSENGTVSVSDGERRIIASPNLKYIESNGHYIWMGETPEVSVDELLIPMESLCLALGVRGEWTGRALIMRSEGSTASDGYDERLLLWLSRVIWAEARGECLEGRIAVGQVVLNRMASPYYPDDVVDVLFQSYQFSTVSNGSIWNDPDESCILAAKLALDGADIVGSECLFFNSCPGKTRGLSYITTIGGHKFYGI